MAAERQDALREFVAVTGAEEDRARFFLESAGWDLQVAPGGGPRRAGRVLWGADTWCLKPSAAEAHSHPAGLRPDPGLRVLGPLATRRQLVLGEGKRRPAQARTDLVYRTSFFLSGWLSEERGNRQDIFQFFIDANLDNRVTSFRDLIHDQDEDEEEEEGQRFYAGGSERSGQQIVGPPRKRSPNELVDDLFKGAKEHGAVAVERVTKSPGETSKPRPFAGGGYRLGAAPEEESAYVAGERRRHSGQDVHVVLKLWKTGFSLDNGELRSYQDPSNAQFLESIRRGEVPAELRRLAHGGQVNLDMEDHRDEDFVKPKGAFKAFTGEGQKLGSTAPQILNTSSPAQQAENEAKASSSISIDESQPTTNIQIRLADGGRLVQKFNHSHRYLALWGLAYSKRVPETPTDT
ncbi:hypothetical protein E5288_WYG004098 [Bos mutus]|uniref:NSFL1 cofactor p47 n=1 Tax=Bos mutus TaxID=72004 RepID=A0A6B0R5V6_9CETA|nr:hypothetical protein [Bos mutus]